MWIPALGRSYLRSLAVRTSVLRGAGPFPKPLGVQDVGGRRWRCSKPDEVKSKNAGSSFKIPGHKPTPFERKILVWGGRYKKQVDIPEILPYEVVDAAKSKVRVKFAILMMLMTIFGCVAMVISGKRAVGRHESLASYNLEKKARLREEAQKEETAKPE